MEQIGLPYIEGLFFKTVVCIETEEISFIWYY